ncbi:MAG: hypothetical protein RIS92_695 [Verrucomicrobiota bacterium]
MSEGIGLRGGGVCEFSGFFSQGFRRVGTGFLGTFGGGFDEEYAFFGFEREVGLASAEFGAKLVGP